MAEREAMVVTHERTATALDRIADALDTLVRPGLPTKKPERRSGLDRNGPAETRDVTQADIQGQQLADGRASGLDCPNVSPRPQGVPGLHDAILRLSPVVVNRRRTDIPPNHPPPEQSSAVRADTDVAVELLLHPGVVQREAFWPKCSSLGMRRCSVPANLAGGACWWFTLLMGSEDRSRDEPADAREARSEPHVADLERREAAVAEREDRRWRNARPPWRNARPPRPSE